MAVRRWTKEECDQIVDIINDYPGNYTYASKVASEVINRSASAILIKFRQIRPDYDTPIIISPKGKTTPKGMLRWYLNPPEFVNVRRWGNIKHLIFG